MPSGKPYYKNKVVGNKITSANGKVSKKYLLSKSNSSGVSIEGLEQVSKASTNFESLNQSAKAHGVSGKIITAICF